MTELIAELSTNHGGDVYLACDMVKAAADAGAHTVKIQSYAVASLNCHDQQLEWLAMSSLDGSDHVRIMNACDKAGVKFLTTPFDVWALEMLIGLGVRRLKVASSGNLDMFTSRGLTLSLIKSWAWGQKPTTYGKGIEAHLTAIPLYPTPLEAVSAAPLLDGYSCHAIGTAACKHMLSKGARVIEKHLALENKGRRMPWDATPAQFREIRDWADTVGTMTTGIATHFRERWLS